MGLFGFGEGKEKKSLEQLAREIIIAKGIKIDLSFNDPRYTGFNIIGVGKTETDSKGALEDFKKSLGRKLPEYVSLIREDRVSLIGMQGKKQKRIYAVGYTRNPRNIT